WEVKQMRYQLSNGIVKCMVFFFMGWLSSPDSFSQVERVHLSSRLHTTFVALGGHITFEVTCWGLSTRPDLLEQAFEKGKLQYNPSHFRIVSATQNRVWTLEQWMPVSRMRWLFVLEPRKRGSLKVPIFTFTGNKTTYMTGQQILHTYINLPERIAAQEGVMPIWVHHRKAGEPIRIGSAFLIRDDAVVTSFHTLVQAREVEIRLPNGRLITTKKAWEMDAKRDIAVLAVNPEVIRKAGLTPLKLAEEYNKTAHLENVVFTAGWPRSRQMPSVGTWSEKENLGLQDKGNKPANRQWISTNAVRPGDSGGALMDEAGRVLGVVSLGDQDRSGEGQKQSMTVSTDPRPVLDKIDWKAKPRRFFYFFNKTNTEDTPYRKLLEASDMLSLAAEKSDYVKQGTIAHYIRQMDDLAVAVEEDARAQFLSGAIYQLIGLREKAVVAYKMALDRDETQFMAAFALGSIALQHARYGEALGYFKKVRPQSPLERFALYGMAQAHLMRNELNASALILEKLLQQDPEDPSVIFWKGIWHLKQGDELSARLMLAKLKSLNLEWADALRRSIDAPGYIAPIPIKPVPVKIVL
ncbi:MAG TPA: hypothetical protein DIW24_09735, partial [Bacteroidetes bacterium]|nr:hypothetical protein [Bacteroidota bacterium]